MLPGPRRTRIQLCGRFVVDLAGRRVENAFPGIQGRVVFAFLALNRLRPIERDELAEAVWGRAGTEVADVSLRALVSKLRRVMGGDAILGKRELSLTLPNDTWIDYEAAFEAIHRAEAAIERSCWDEAWWPTRIALNVSTRDFLPGASAPWVEERRRALANLRLRAHECVAAVALGHGGAELASAERSARALIQAAPFRENGHRLLMEALAARGNVAEALMVYQELCRLLRDELGASPGAQTQALQRTLRDTSDASLAPGDRPGLTDPTDSAPDGFTVTGDLRFRILGPIDVMRGDRPVALGGPRQRALLAFLLLHPNQSVSTDRLIDELWTDHDPAAAVKAVQVAIGRLRKALEAHRPSGDREPVLRTVAGGYCLVLAPGQLDADVFRRRVEAAQRALADDPARASDLFREALGFWRGPALSDVMYESFARGEIALLEELRLSAIEGKAEADVRVGRHGELVGELQSLVAAHPMRERLTAQLMLALYRVGRQADALAVYRETRARLDTQLGLEPSAELRELETAILTHDPRLASSTITWP